MAGETVITVIGNLTADPELRFTPGGDAVANFTIASTPRTFDRQANDWKDGDTLFLRANAWREAAENIAESLTKGTRVVAQGRLKSRSYDTKEGEKRTVMELEVDEIGPSLRYASAQVTRTQRGGQGGQQGGQGQQGGWGGQQGGQQAQGWGGQPQGQQGGQQGWGGQQAPQGQPQGQQGAQQGWGAPQGQQAAADPWGAPQGQPQGQQGQQGWQNPGDSEPPF